MTTRLSIALFILIVASMALDIFVLDTGLTVATLRRGLDLLQTMAFWR